jgi:hypothetical protein
VEGGLSGVVPPTDWANAAGAAHSDTAIVSARAKARKSKSSFVGLRG